MRKGLLLMCYLLQINLIYGNNIQVSNVRLTGQNTIDDFTMVEFDITWENSWRSVGGPGNWDAAWIFVKYRIGAGPWMHAWLNDIGHSFCAGTTVSPGLLTPGSAFNPATNPCLGVFLYRSDPGSGTFNCTNVQLRWNYAENDLSDNEQLDIKVFAIEHVYVPQGSFKVGSGGTESGAFYTYPTTTNPFLIASEAAITVGASNGNLYYQNTSGSSGDQLGPIPALYPKGYAAFYMMKYEISQQGYVDFLNTLTRAQQINRVQSNISGSGVSENYILVNFQNPVNRNGVCCFNTVPPAPSPVIIFCDQNVDGNYNGMNDGQNIACNFIHWGDLTAYLDWAGLRPMTEFEFEKCSRGTIDPIPNEFCWGNNYGRESAILTNAGFPNESIADTFANLSKVTGAVRCGLFAKSFTDRTFSGATYYGSLDFSGNIWEQGVTIGAPAGRSFQGHHGDGLLTAAGNNNVTSWPGSSSGPCLRGGSYSEGWVFQDPAISGRRLASYAVTSRQANIGGRGCRIAPN